MPREQRVRHVDWYADEWLAGTAGLDATERGVYDTIINLIYSRGGPISNDRRELARRCGMHGNALAKPLKRLIELGKILETGSEIFVKRCGNELEKARKRARKAWENGEKGGRPSKKINDVAKPTGCFSANLTNNSFLLSLKEERDPKEKKHARDALKAEFAQWWLAYPHKVAKAAAEQKFAIARRSTSLDELLDGVRRYIETKPAEHAWCNPASWLHQQRWLDQPATLNGEIPHARRQLAQAARPGPIDALHQGAARAAAAVILRDRARAGGDQRAGVAPVEPLLDLNR